MLVYGSSEHWIRVRAAILKFFIQVLDDPYHPRQRLYSLLDQKSAEIGPNKTSLSSKLQNVSCLVDHQ
jgi:hypothetical protein